jgi:hypothetical protein
MPPVGPLGMSCPDILGNRSGRGALIYRSHIGGARTEGGGRPLVPVAAIDAELEDASGPSAPCVAHRRARGAGLVSTAAALSESRREGRHEHVAVWAQPVQRVAPGKVGLAQDAPREHWHAPRLASSSLEG